MFGGLLLRDHRISRTHRSVLRWVLLQATGLHGGPDLRRKHRVIGGGIGGCLFFCRRPCWRCSAAVFGIASRNLLTIYVSSHALDLILRGEMWVSWRSETLVYKPVSQNQGKSSTSNIVCYVGKLIDRFVVSMEPSPRLTTFCSSQQVKLGGRACTYLNSIISNVLLQSYQQRTDGSGRGYMPCGNTLPQRHDHPSSMPCWHIQRPRGAG